MAVSLTRWFGRLQADTRSDTRRYRPQRELLHRLVLSLARADNVHEQMDPLLSELMRQSAVASGFTQPVWLAWRACPDSSWNLVGTGDSASTTEANRLSYQLDLATRADRVQIQPTEPLAQEAVHGIRLPDGDSGLQLWLLAPAPSAEDADFWRDVLRDLGQAVREGLDLRLTHQRELTLQRQQHQQALAASLHDSVAQQLCYLCLQTGRLEQQADQLSSTELAARLQDIRLQTRQAYRQTRELISSARIRLQRSLEQELQSAIAEFEQHSGLMFELDNRLASSQLPEPVAVEVLLIVREALSNAVRHAHARQVRIQLLPHGKSGFHIRVQDDGQGLPQQRSPDSFGLGIMEERAQRIGASLQILSTPQEGTCIELTAEEICP